ncbi:MAG: ATP-binding protein [Gemmatimonadota bacterium]
MPDPLSDQAGPTDASRPSAPPLAVVTAVARALAAPGTPGERYQALCDQLTRLLPAEEVRLLTGQRRSDRLGAGHAEPEALACVVDVPFGPGRSAVLEVLGSARPPAELRPMLETVAAMLAATMPGLEDGAGEQAGIDRALNLLTVDSLPVGLYVIDREFRIVMWNRKRETGTQGLRRADVLGRQVFEVLHRQDPEALREEFTRVFATGEVAETEHAVRFGGEKRTYRTTRLPMRIDGQRVSHVVTIGEDVTETREIEIAMHQTEKLAAVGQLAAGVMHEINNPLATIGACVAAITSRLGPTAEPVVREYLDIIESEVGRCTNIVDGLLDFSRAGRAGDGFLPTDVNALLERTLYLLKHHQRFRRLVLDREMADDLPMVPGNTERLIQAAMAILLNAADATGGRGKVRIRTAFESPWVIIELTDDGPGIPAEVLPKIFEPFYTTKGPTRGTGLGLAISYGIIADHHGHLDVRSEPGGTTFRIALPPVRSTERS